MIKSIPTPKGNVVIREANLADAEQFRALRLFALQESPTAFSADYQVNLNQPMSFWEGRLTFDEYGMIFLAEHNSQVIGMTGIRKGESPKTKHGAYIWGVYIHPEWRGFHLAEALIETCNEWATTAREIDIVKLGVVKTNASAIRCYQRCGFEIYGTEPRCIYYDGVYYDEFLMFKNLKPS